MDPKYTYSSEYPQTSVRSMVTSQLCVSALNGCVPMHAHVRFVVPQTTNAPVCCAADLQRGRVF